MVLTMVDPPEIEQAKAIIANAIEREPSNPELLDSQGRIFLKGNELANAIACFEKAISVSPDRINTREALIDAYEKSGLPEMAKAQRQVIQEKSEVKP